MASAKTSTSQRLENSEDIDETVRKARQTAIELMRKAGYDVGTKVKVVVDPQLPFIGYRRIIPRTMVRSLKKRLTILVRRRFCATINRKLSTTYRTTFRTSTPTIFRSRSCAILR